MKNIFHLNTTVPYNLMSRNERYYRKSKTIKHGTETIAYLVPKIWSLFPKIIKISNVNFFKSEIKQWKLECLYGKIFLERFLFYLLFGCPTTNFEPLSRGQPH